MELAGDWGQLLRAEAFGYARVALTNIKREFPSGVYHSMVKPGDFPFRPRARTPAFYGSYDWHSCVEMHWVLLRLLRIAIDKVPEKETRQALHAHFSPVALAADAPGARVTRLPPFRTCPMPAPAAAPLTARRS